MTWFPDLTPYHYDPSVPTDVPGTLNVGWLDEQQNWDWGKWLRSQSSCLCSASASIPGGARDGWLLPASSWRAEVVAAENRRKLDRLLRTFELAPLAAAQRAAKAPLLLFAIDEPGDPSLPTELDGERPHDVCVGLVDLAAEKLLFRLRRRVDPSWLSDQRRAEYARGVDGCVLAVDVHQAVAGNRPSAPVEPP